MKQLLGTTASRRRGIQGGPLASKHAADARARALASTLRELRAAGFVSRQSVADELNRRGVPTVRGGKWHCTTIVRMLTRLGIFGPGKGKANNGQTGKWLADARARALASTIRELRAKGLVSSRAIAHALNEREVPTVLGSRWHPGSVSRLLARLKNLEQVPSRHEGRFSTRGIDLVLGWQVGTPGPARRSSESDPDSGGLVLPIFNVLTSRDRATGPLGESEPICDMDLEGILRNREQSFGCRSVPVGLLQRRDSLALAVEAA